MNVFTDCPVAILTAVLLAGLSGCAPSKEAAITDVEILVERRSSLQLSASTDLQEEDIRARTQELLAKELDVNAAVQVAILNNRRLRANLQDVAVARAALVGSGTPENPKVEAGFRHVKDGDSETFSRYGVSQDVTSLIFAPLRKRGPNARFEAAKLRAGHEALDLIAQVKTAFFSLQAADQSKELVRSVSKTTVSAAELARRQFEAGNINQLTLSFQETLAQEAALELVRVETDVELARRKLEEILGVQGLGVEWKTSSTLPPLPDSTAVPANLEELALEQRLDLESMRQELKAWERSKSAARAAFTPPIELGFEREEEIDGTLQGPTVEAQIPLFDRGQGDRQLASAESRRTNELLAASEARVRTEVLAALAQLREAEREVDFLQNRIIPLRERIVAETQLHYNFMLQGVYQLLEAKREELKAREEAINSSRNYWIAWTELERAVGGSLQALEQSAE